MASDLLTMTLELAESLGRVPVFIVGDFNLNLDGHDLYHILSWAGWEDLLQGMGPTCKGTAGTESKIDYVLGNKTGRAQVTKAGIHWDTGIATHALLIIELKQGPDKKGWVIRPALNLFPQTNPFPKQKYTAYP